MHVITKQGWDIIRNSLLLMNNQNSLEDIFLQDGEEQPILLNEDGYIRILKGRIYIIVQAVHIHVYKYSNGIKHRCEICLY